MLVYRSCVVRPLSSIRSTHRSLTHLHIKVSGVKYLVYDLNFHAYDTCKVIPHLGGWCGTEWNVSETFTLVQVAATLPNERILVNEAA